MSGAAHAHAHGVLACCWTSGRPGAAPSPAGRDRTSYSIVYPDLCWQPPLHAQPTRVGTREACAQQSGSLGWEAGGLARVCSLRMLIGYQVVAERASFDDPLVGEGGDTAQVNDVGPARTKPRGS